MDVVSALWMQSSKVGKPKPEDLHAPHPYFHSFSQIFLNVDKTRLTWNAIMDAQHPLQRAYGLE
jgi:hypothetical protein